MVASTVRYWKVVWVEGLETDGFLQLRVALAGSVHAAFDLDTSDHSQVEALGWSSCRKTMNVVQRDPVHPAVGVMLVVWESGRIEGRTVGEEGRFDVWQHLGAVRVEEVGVGAAKEESSRVPSDAKVEEEGD